MSRVILVIGQTRERAMTLLRELFEENMDQVNLEVSTPCLRRVFGTFWFKDGTRFIAKSRFEGPKEFLGFNVDQVFFEEGAFPEEMELQVHLASVMMKSNIPREFQWVKLTDEREVLSERKNH